MARRSPYSARLAGEYTHKGSPGFVGQMRRLLQLNMATHYEPGHKKGKLSPARLWRVGMPPVDGGDWNARVFKQRSVPSDVLDTAVFLLVDWSGSMSGRKSMLAAQAAGLINEAFGTVLRIPLKVAAFTCMSEAPTIGIMKNWNALVSNEAMGNGFASFLGHMSGNNDADSIAWAYNDLLMRREKRKILIVMSDGSPADGIGDPYYALKRVVGEIEKAKLVEIYGLGIVDKNVELFYKQHRVVNELPMLEPTLVDLLGSALLHNTRRT